MKNIRTKIAQVLSYIYGVGVMVSLFVGALSFIGYLVAIIIGGTVASDICVFIYKTIYPVIIYLASVSVLLGLVKMYVAGEKSLAPDKKKKLAQKIEKTQSGQPENNATPNQDNGAETQTTQKD